MNIDNKPTLSNLKIQDIGPSMKAERKLKGLSIEEISEKTRIPKAYLINLENNQFELLPGIGYIPGFIRNYCKAIKLDPYEYIEAFKNSEKLMESKPKYKFPVQALVPKMAGSTVAMFSVLLILSSYVGWILLKNNNIEESITEANNNGNKSENYSIETNVLSKEKKEKIINFEKNFIPEMKYADNNKTFVNNKDLSNLYNENEDEISFKITKNKKLEIVNNDLINKDRIVKDIRSQNLGSSAAQATKRLPNKEIIIRANSTSWVEITKSNGEIIVSRLMRDGDRLDATANENFYFSTGNAGALTIETNSISAFKLGKIGEILRDLPLNLEVISVRKSLIEF